MPDDEMKTVPHKPFGNSSSWAFSSHPWLAEQHQRITAHELAKHELSIAPDEVIRRTYQGETVIRRRR